MSGFGFGNGGTEFYSMLPPPHDALKDYDNTRHWNSQSPSVPQIFLDAMSVREEVYAEQGVPLEAEFDEDDSRSWHWVVYASVASTSGSPSSELSHSSSNRGDDARRSSASASRVPVGTIRLIPPPHGPNPYAKTTKLQNGDRHSDADPPTSLHVDAHVEKKHPDEPYIKLGRLAVLSSYRKMGLSKLLVNTAIEYASKHPESIRPPPSPTTLEHASLKGEPIEESSIWKGLAMVHAQVSVAPLWIRHGFAEELVNEEGEVEISKEERWVEEGIEHMGMWKRINVDSSRL